MAELGPRDGIVRIDSGVSLIGGLPYRALHSQQ